MDRARIERIKAEVLAERRFPRGSRMRPEDILAYLNAGLTKAELLREFPDLSEEDVRKALGRVSHREKELASHAQKTG